MNKYIKKFLDSSYFWRGLGGVLIVSLILLIWSGSYFLVSLSARFSIVGTDPQISDIMTLLFGSSSIALFLFSIIFAFLALIGWQNIKDRLERVDKWEGEFQNKFDDLKKSTLDRIEAMEASTRGRIEAMEALTRGRIEVMEASTRGRIETMEASTWGRIEAWGSKMEVLDKERITPLENEMKGRVHSVLGYILGEMSINRETLEILNSDRLIEAVTLCQQGYKFLKSDKKRDDDPAKFMALNNLVFYLTFTSDASRIEFLLEEARLLRKVAQEHDSANLLLTACKALLLFSSDEQEKAIALEILAAILSKQHATPKEKREAGIYLKRFGQKPPIEAEA